MTASWSISLSLLVSGLLSLAFGGVQSRAREGDAMKRRTFLATGAAVLAAPGILRAQTKANVLRFVPETRGVDSDMLAALWRREDVAAASR